MLKERRFTDCFVVSGRDHIPAHQCVLLAACPNFKTMITPQRGGKQPSLILTGVLGPEAIRDLLAYIYRGTINESMSFESMRDLLLSTNELAIAGMQERMEKLIAQRLDASCFFELVQVAHERSFPVLMEACVEFFSHHHRSICISERWRQLMVEKGELSAMLLEKVLYRNLKRSTS